MQHEIHIYSHTTFKLSRCDKKHAKFALVQAELPRKYETICFDKARDGTIGVHSAWKFRCLGTTP